MSGISTSPLSRVSPQISNVEQVSTIAMTVIIYSASSFSSCKYFSPVSRYFPLVLLSAGLVSPSPSFSCPAPPGLVCDPSLETGDHLSSAHLASWDQCQQACALGHPANLCR